MNTAAGSNIQSNAGKGCVTIFLGVFAIVGLVLLGFIGKSSFETARTFFWVNTDCAILESTVRERGDRFEMDVRYRYRFNGRALTGNRFSTGMRTSMNAGDAERARHRYAAGNNATCYVNSSAPAESVLERGSLWFLLLAPIPLIFAVMGVGGIVAVWRAPRPEQRTAISERLRSRGGATTVLRILGLIFALAGGALLYVMLVRPMLKEAAAAKWLAVECEILSSRLSSHSGSKGGSTYSIEIRYRYRFGDVEHTGTRYNFETGSSSSRKWRAAVVAGFRPGMKTVCRVNPADPFEAVLSTQASPDRWFGLIPGIFLAAGLFLFLKAPSMGGGRIAGQGRSTAMPAPLRGGTGGGAELKPAVAPMTGCIVMLVIALFWNGIVWAILLNMGRGEILGRVFLGVFALIGAGLIALAVHQFLGLFNPRPVLTANSLSIPLGGMLEVQWRFTGSVRRLTRLVISCEAREEATYRRGTDTTTDRNVFANLTLADTTDRGRMSSGHAKLTIPAGLMHTLPAPNNKVVWTLRVAGDIPRWPDVSAEFPITILPLEAAPAFIGEESGT